MLISPQQFLQRQRCRSRLIELLATSETEASSQRTATQGFPATERFVNSIFVRSLPLWGAFSASAFAWCYLAPITVPVFPLLGYLAPVLLLRHRRSTSASTFAADFAPMLLGTASLLKAGFCLHDALRSASEALPSQSPVRSEVMILIRKFEAEIPSPEALSDFGRASALPELQLFRSALQLSLAHGGAFSETLSRLAKVTSERMLLIRAATAATAQMRLTAHIVLLLLPLFMGLSFLREPGTLAALPTHSIAHATASIGLAIILANYLFLLHLSDFEP